MRVKKILLLIGMLSCLPFVMPTANATPPDVTVMYKEGVGNYLVDARARTLYWRKGERARIASLSRFLLMVFEFVWSRAKESSAESV